MSETVVDAIDDPVLAHRQGDVLVLTLNQPQRRNPLSAPVIERIRAHLDPLADPAAPGPAAIVLTGAGGWFCSGGDLRRLQERAGQTVEQRLAFIGGLHGLIHSLRACSRPVVAAVEGGAAGAGLSLALGADIVIAAEGAKFSGAYVRVGLSPDGGLTHALAQLLPRSLAAEMLLTGDPVTAERLAALGVVNRVVPQGDSLNEAMAFADRLASGARRAQARVKRLLDLAPQQTLDAQLESEAQLMAASQGDPDAIEAIAAFLQRRPPDFGSTR